MEVFLKMGDITNELLIPGFKDSILAIKNPVQAFGIMAS